MAFKRYIRRHGKKLGPYYYENVRSNDGRVKSVYLGTNPGHHPRHRIKKPLFFLILILVLILILGGSLFLLQNKSYLIKKVKAQEPDFEIDQILLKVLIRSNEFIEKQVRIMNTGNDPAGIDVFASGLGDIVTIDSSSFIIKPGQTKIVNLKFSGVNPEQNIEQQPGIYVGKLIAKSEKAAKEVPIVVEIETKNVLFDMNLNPVAIERRVKQGADTTIEVRLFNLESIESVNVDVEYFVKDMNGNTISTETETVVAKTQASFFKTISIPKNLKPGPYVFAAIAKFGNSIGTSSYLFEVVGPEIESSFVQFCKNSILCLGLSLTTILLLFALIAYFYFFIGAYLYEKVTGVATIPKKEKIEAQATKGPGFFERFAIRIGQRRKRRKKEKAEREELERRQDLERMAQERRSQLEKEKAKLEEERRLEEEKRKMAGEKKQPEPKGFFHKIGFLKAPEEKKRIAEQKEKESRERIKAEEQEKRQKELEAKRGLESGQKKQQEEEKTKKRELEEQRRKQLEEERKRLDEQRLKEQAEREKELEKQKALEEKKRLEEERRKKEEQLERQKELEKQKALEYKRKLEEEKAKKEEEKKAEEEQLKKQREAERQGQELAKAQKLAAIKQLEEKFARNKELAQQLREELRKIESEKRQLTSSNNETDAKVKKVDHEILEKSRHSEELSLQKNSIFEHYKKRLDELAKIRESKKAAKEEKARDIRAKLAAKQEAMVKELEGELSKLSIEKRKATEKWKRLEIKAKLKIEEQNIEEQIKKEEQSDGKQAIDDNYKKSIEELGKKQNSLKNEIAQMERQKQEILLERKNAPRELAAKENELQRVLSKLESNAKEKEELAAELAKLKSELSAFNLGFLKKIISSYKEKSEKARKEKEEEKARLEIEKKREEEATRKEKELEEKTEKLEETRKRKEDERKSKEEQKRKALEEKEKLKAEKQKGKGKLKPEIKPGEYEPEAKEVEEKKTGLFGKLFGKRAQAEEKITLHPSEEIDKKPGIFSKMFAKRHEDEGKDEIEDAIEEKPKAKKSEAEELEEAIRGLDLFQQVEKGGRIKAKEAPKLFGKLIKKEDKEKPGKVIFSAFKKKKEEPEEPAEEHKEAEEPVMGRLFGKEKNEEEAPKKSLFGKLFEKKEKKEDDAGKKPLLGRLFAKKEVNAVEEIVEKKEKRTFKSKKLEKFHKIIDSAHSALEKNDKAKAKKLYLEARESYIKLEYNEKKEVYNSLTELYNKLAK